MLIASRFDNGVEDDREATERRMLFAHGRRTGQVLDLNCGTPLRYPRDCMIHCSIVAVWLPFRRFKRMW